MDRLSFVICMALVAIASASELGDGVLKQRGNYIGKEATNLPAGTNLEGLSIGLDGNVYQENLKSVQKVM